MFSYRWKGSYSKLFKFICLCLLSKLNSNMVTVATVFLRKICVWLILLIYQ
jgi:hypothetical protein